MTASLRRARIGLAQEQWRQTLQTGLTGGLRKPGRRH